MTWNFTLSGETLDRVTFKLGNDRIGKKSSSGIVSIDPVLNFQEHFDISRSDPATLIIYNASEADEAVFSCIVETVREWTDEIEVRIVGKSIRNLLVFELQYIFLKKKGNNIHFTKAVWTFLCHLKLQMFDGCTFEFHCVPDYVIEFIKSILKSLVILAI